MLLLFLLLLPRFYSPIVSWLPTHWLKIVWIQWWCRFHYPIVVVGQRKVSFVKESIAKWNFFPLFLPSPLLPLPRIVQVQSRETNDDNNNKSTKGACNYGKFCTEWLDILGCSGIHSVVAGRVQWTGSCLDRDEFHQISHNNQHKNRTMTHLRPRGMHSRNKWWHCWMQCRHCSALF